MTRVEYPIIGTTDEMREWLKTECNHFQAKLMIDDKDSIVYHVIEFEDDNDAIMFKLRWCDAS